MEDKVENVRVFGIVKQLKEWLYSKTALKINELGPGVFIKPIYIKKVSYGTAFAKTEYPKEWIRIFFSTDKNSNEYISFIHLEEQPNINGYNILENDIRTLEIYTDNLHSEYNKSLHLEEVKVD